MWNSGGFFFLPHRKKNILFLLVIAELSRKCHLRGRQAQRPHKLMRRRKRGLWEALILPKVCICVGFVWGRTETVSVCVCACMCVCMCVCVCACPSQAIPRKLLKSSSSNSARWLPQTWECITCQLYWTWPSFKVTHIIMKISVWVFQKLFNQCPHQVCCEDSPTCGWNTFCFSLIWPFTVDWM